MKNASKLLVAAAALATCAALTVPDAHAGPMGPSAKSAARLKKYPTSSWLAHYLPDDRYKIAGGVWKYVSTDLDTFYHRPNSPLMLRQPAGRVIGFSSAAEAEEAGYRPDPSIGSFGDIDMGGMGSAGAAVVTSRRVTLADGVSSLALPSGWKKSASRTQKSPYVNSTTERFYGPKGQRFEVSTMMMNMPANTSGRAVNLDMGQLITVEFFNRLKTNMRSMAGNIDNIAARSGSVNSQFSGQNMVRALSELDKYRIFKINLGGMDGVGTSATKTVAGKPIRSYSVGRGSKVWSINDYSPRPNSLAPILKSVRFR